MLINILILNIISKINKNFDIFFFIKSVIRGDIFDNIFNFPHPTDFFVYFLIA